MTREEFDEKCGLLYEIYNKIFYETLKESALNVWLSDTQWEDLCWFSSFWDNYTDFFSNLEEELNRRYDNWYYDISDLLSPSTKNLKFQITETIIRKEFLRHIILFASFDKKLEYLAEINIYKLYEMFCENQLENYIKQKIPPHSFYNEISIKYNEDELMRAYNEVLKVPLYPEKDFDFDYIWIWGRYRDDFFSLYEKDPEDKDSILKFLNKTAWLFNDFSYDIIYCRRNVVDDEWCIKKDNKWGIIIEWFSEEPIFTVEKNSHFLDVNGRVVDKLDWYLLEILKKYKNDVLWDAQIVYLYYWYIVEKLKGSIFVEQLVNDWSLKSTSWKNFISFNEIKNLISNFKDTQDIYEILQIYYMLYSDILKREGCEQFLKEVIYRLKKISDKDNQIVLWLKEYLTYIINIVFIYEYWRSRPKYFDSITEDVKEVLWEKEFRNIEQLISKNFISKWDRNTRKKFKIWLIFWDSRSKKAFELYSNDKKNEKDFTDRQLERWQFVILAEEYHDQQNLDIEWKLKRGDLTFVLVFETDHETKLRNLMKIYPDRVIVCNVPGQHFSFEKFRKMLDCGLENVK